MYHDCHFVSRQNQSTNEENCQFGVKPYLFIHSGEGHVGFSEHFILTFKFN